MGRKKGSKNNKHLSEKLLRERKQERSQENNKFVYYVAGMLDGEGNIGNYTISIYNTNKFLIDTISKFLNKIKIINKIVKRKKLPNRKLCYQLRISGKENLERFYTYIPFIHKKKRRILYKNINRIYVRRRLTKSEKLLIIRLKKQKISYSKIAKQTGINRSTIIMSLWRKQQ